MELQLLAICENGRPDADVSLCDTAREVCDANVALYRQTGYLPPWIGYVAQLDGEIVGTCAFKSPPREGSVEIAYFTFPQYERRGIATEMAQRLVWMALVADQSIVVTAQTLPEENASTTILRRLGFIQSGTAHDSDVGEVWAWQLSPK